MSHVLACIDGSVSAAAVCDYATWACQRLAAPLTFLHVLDRQQYPGASDLSGSIGLGSREHLLDELAALDEQRGRIALEHGRLLLEAAQQRATAAGVIAPAIRQRHGNLVETLQDLEDDIRLLVIGRQGEAGGTASRHIGSQLESVVRTMRRPILVTSGSFLAPASLMLAFDDSATTRKGVEMVANSPLFSGLPIHLVMVGAATKDAAAQLRWAADVLEGTGFPVTTAIRAGEVEAALHAYQDEHGLDLLIMGAYGHSRIRQFLVGSTTTNMLRTTGTPLLLLR